MEVEGKCKKRKKTKKMYVQSDLSCAPSKIFCEKHAYQRIKLLCVIYIWLAERSLKMTRNLTRPYPGGADTETKQHGRARWETPTPKESRRGQSGPQNQMVSRGNERIQRNS